MKKIIILAFIFAYQLSFSQWEAPSPIENSQAITIAYDFGNIIYAGWSPYTFYKSLDNGRYWNVVNTDGNRKYEKMTKLSDRILAIINDTLSYSTNEGKTWNAIDFPFNDSIGPLGSFGPIVTSGDNLYMATDYKVIKSSDKGNHWVELNLSKLEQGEEYPIYISNIISTNGYLFAYNFEDWYITKDDGTHWTLLEDLHQHSLIYANQDLLYVIDQVYEDDVSKISKITIYKIQDDTLTKISEIDVSNISIPSNLVSFKGKSDKIQLLTNKTLYIYDLQSQKWDSTSFNNDDISAACLGDNRYLAFGINSFYESLDAGKTWNTIYTNFKNNPTWGLAVDAFRLYIINSNGVYFSDNRGNNWNLLNDTLPATSYSALAVRGDRIVVATVDNTIYFSRDRGKTWRKSETFPKYSCRVENIEFYEERTVLAYGPFVYITTDDGESWSYTRFNTSHAYVAGTFRKGDSLCAILKSDGIFISTDFGQSWKLSFKNDTNPHEYTMDYSIFGNEIILATTKRNLRSCDLGETWSELPFPTDNPMFPLVDPNQRIYLVDSIIISHNITADLYLYTNGSQTYKRINGNLPKDYIASVKIFGGYIFLATGTGIYRAALSRFGILSAENTEPSNTTESLFVYPNPADDYITIKNTNEQDMLSDIIIYEMRGSIAVSKKPGNSELQIIDVSSLPCGAYFIKQGTKSAIFIKK